MCIRDRGYLFQAARQFFQQPSGEQLPRTRVFKTPGAFLSSPSGRQADWPMTDRLFPFGTAIALLVGRRSLDRPLVDDRSPAPFNVDSPEQPSILFGAARPTRRQHGVVCEQAGPLSLGRLLDPQPSRILRPALVRRRDLGWCKYIAPAPGSKDSRQCPTRLSVPCDSTGGEKGCAAGTQLGSYELCVCMSRWRLRELGAAEEARKYPSGLTIPMELFLGATQQPTFLSPGWRLKCSHRVSI